MINLQEYQRKYPNLALSREPTYTRKSVKGKKHLVRKGRIAKNDSYIDNFLVPVGGIALGSGLATMLITRKLPKNIVQIAKQLSKEPPQNIAQLAEQLTSTGVKNRRGDIFRSILGGLQKVGNVTFRVGKKGANEAGKTLVKTTKKGGGRIKKNVEKSLAQYKDELNNPFRNKPAKTNPVIEYLFDRQKEVNPFDPPKQNFLFRFIKKKDKDNPFTTTQEKTLFGFLKKNKRKYDPNNPFQIRKKRRWFRRKDPNNFFDV